MLKYSDILLKGRVRFMPHPVARVACIHDMSCFGRCSLTVALPVLSAMGVCAVPLPAAVFSTHTGGFTDMAIVDLTEYMRRVIAHWESLDMRFDAVYTGFLAGEEQFAVVEHFLARFGANALKLVDPVMGDHGRLYSTYTPDMCARAGQLAAGADIITPNLTEACLLCGLAYPEKGLDASEAESLCRRLGSIAARSVITGITLRDGSYGSAAYDGLQDAYGFYTAPYHTAQMHGAGDVFSSVLLGYVLRGEGLLTATEKTVRFLSEVCARTAAVGRPTRDGLEFEPLLWQLAPDASTL